MMYYETNGCKEEFSPDPNFSDLCGSEVRCETCGTCTAHCRCERVPDLDRARVITANLIEELRAIENVDPEACPGCSCLPGDGIAEGCDDGDGHKRAKAARRPPDGSRLRKLQ